MAGSDESTRKPGRAAADEPTRKQGPAAADETARDVVATRVEPRPAAFVDTAKLGMADTAKPDLDTAVLGKAPKGDPLVRAVSRAKIEAELFAAHEDVTLGRYRLLELVGSGGMGVVWGAWDPELDRRVAIKLVREAQSTNEALYRFARETKITARLEHPSIVPVYDAGGTIESPYYVMRHVSGQPLSDLIAARPSLDERLALIPHLLAAAQGIAHAHGRGIVHRDIKPPNMLVGALGETVVIDWGLAKVIDEADEKLPEFATKDPLRTHVGTVFGTPGFMAPEQLRGEPVGPPADVYALGASLYYLLANQPPHAAKTGDEMMVLASAGPPVPIAQLVPGVPPELTTIVDRALAFDDRLRYPDAGAFAEDLQRFLTGQLVASHRYTRRERLIRFVRRHRTAVAIGTIATVVVAVLAWIAIARILTERDRADRQAQIAEHRLADQYEEQGRLSLLADRSGPALVYFLAAMDKGAPRTVALDYMIDQAVRRLEAQRAVLRGHTSRIAMLDLSRDGKRALTASYDGTARIWDLAAGTSIAVATGDPSLMVARWSPAGDKFLTAGTSGVPRIYASDGKLLHELRVSDEPTLMTPAFSPDGSTVLVPYLDGTLVLWEVASGAKRASTKSALVRPDHAALSPDGKVALVKAGAVAEVRDAQTLALVTTLEGHKRPIVDIAFSQTHVALASRDRTITVWEMATWKLVHHLQGDTNVVNSVAFDPSGTKLVSTNDDGTARVWDVAGGEPRFHLLGHRASVKSARFTLDGSRVVTASVDGTARVWNAASGVPLATFEGHHGEVASLAIGNDVVATGGADGTLRIYPLESDRRVLLGHDKVPAKFTFSISADGRQLTSGGEQTVWIWDTATGAPVSKLEGAVDARFHPRDPTRLAVLYPKELQVLHDGKLEHRTSAITNAIEYLPDGRRIAFAEPLSPGDEASAFGVKTWEPSTGNVAHLATHTKWVHVLDTADDLVMTAGWDQTVHVSRLSTNTTIALRHDKHVVRVAVDPSRRYVVTGSLENQAHVWDVRTGALVRTLPTGDMTSVIAFDDSGHILTAGKEPSAKVWKLDNGSLVATLDGHTQSIQRAAFTKGLIVTAGDETIRIWDLAGRQLSISRAHAVTIQTGFLAGDYFVTGSFDRSIAVSPIGVRHLELAALQQLAACLPVAMSDSRLIARAPDDRCVKGGAR